MTYPSLKKQYKLLNLFNFIEIVFSRNSQLFPIHFSRAQFLLCKKCIIALIKWIGNSWEFLENKILIKLNIFNNLYCFFNEG